MQLRPSRNEVLVALAFAVVFLFASWLRRGEKIAALESDLAAKPRVEYRDRIVEKRVVVKGPSRIIKVKGPDGTVTTTTDRAPETVSTEKDRDVENTETPICPPPYRPKSRYVGLIVGKDGYQGSWVKGVRGGINVIENWDLGVNLIRDRSGDSAVGGDLSFRW